LVNSSIDSGFLLETTFDVDSNANANI
jgi:hypothetical protein